MPRLEDGENVKKVFKKISYRPWNIFFDENNENFLKENNKETIGKQLGNKKNKVEVKKETIRKPIRKQKLPLIRKQLGNKKNHGIPSIELIKNLYGLQKKILFYIVEDCISRGVLTSSKVCNETLRIIANTDADSVKTSIQRLIKKSILIRKKGKRGKGGFTIFLITEEIRNAVIEEQRQLEIGKQLVNKLVNNKETNKETKSLSSSSLRDIKTTTTEESSQSLPDEWKEIDLSGFQKRGIMFGQNHLISFWDFLKRHSAFDFQESVDGFIYDIDNKILKTEKGYLNFFIGIIRKGNLYVSSHYVSSEQKKMNEMMTAANARKAEREALQRKLYDEKFYAWLETYGKEKIKDQLPVGYWVGFEHAAPEIMEWIKKNIYEKIIFDQAL